MAKELAAERKLRPVALAALRYVAEIDAPNLREPWSIARLRTELVDVVHAHQGRPERTRRDVAVLRLTQPPAPQQQTTAQPMDDDHELVGEPATPEQKARFRALHGRGSKRSPRELLERDLDVRARELHDAGAKLGAEANKHVRNHERVAELRRELDAAARAFSLAERRLHDFKPAELPVSAAAR